MSYHTHYDSKTVKLGMATCVSFLSSPYGKKIFIMVHFKKKCRMYLFSFDFRIFNKQHQQHQSNDPSIKRYHDSFTSKKSQAGFCRIKYLQVHLYSTVSLSSIRATTAVFPALSVIRNYRFFPSWS